MAGSNHVFFIRDGWVLKKWTSIYFGKGLGPQWKIPIIFFNLLLTLGICDGLASLVQLSKALLKSCIFLPISSYLAIPAITHQKDFPLNIPCIADVFVLIHPLE